jgi:dTDP-4-dehydrorhamnose reductase
MNVLILGGTGLLGSALRLARPGAVRAFTHCNNSTSESIHFDVRNCEPFSESPDIVISCFPFARIFQSRSEKDFVAISRRFASMCRRARIVQLSTDAVFDGSSSNYSEADLPNSLNGYGQKQIILDSTLLNNCPGALVVRTSFLFGAAGKQIDKRLGPLLSGQFDSSAQRWPVNVYRSPTEVNFCAEGIWRALEREITGVINICGERLSIADFFCKALSPLTSLTHPSPFMETRPEVARDSSLNPRLMRTRLDLKPEEVWSWYQERLPQQS